MSNTLCRTALRFSTSARTRSLSNIYVCSQRLPLRSAQKNAALSRPFSTSGFLRDNESSKKQQELTDEAERQELRTVTSGKSAQTLENDRPWHRESSHAQPESTSPDPTHGDATKGRLLTTPTRLLKLILPMPFHPKQEHINEPIEEGKNKDATVQPLALLVHPQQPLSYLERLIQAEIPPLRQNGRDKLPDIVFRAEGDQEETPKEKAPPKDGNVASYSGLGHEGPDRKHAQWVRWSGSTEVGDFIRDAARGREFAIDIEGHEKELRVAVPSFKDRTYYMRTRLRRMSREIETMSKVKSECDELAHQGAHRIAQGGFFALAGWWGVVYYITFHTEMGWDLVEPITYLVGLTTVLGGYWWFLYISRDLSYRTAMKITVSKRQSALYQERGFDEAKWEQLVHEANMLRKEIRFAAEEYDVRWNEMKDIGEDVKEVLEAEKKKSGGGKKEGSQEEDDNDAAGEASQASSKSKSKE